MPKFRKLLKNKEFVLYSAGQTFSQFGDRLVQIVLIGFVYKRWPGSTIQLAKLFFFTVLPSFFISPIAGVCIDRWDKRRVMIASDLCRAAAVLLVPLFFLKTETAIPLYLAVFFIFAAGCFFLPARLSIIPSLVPPEDLLLANSASSITWVLAGIAGFSLGGVLAEFIGIKNSLYINSIIYVLSAASFLGLLFSMRHKMRAERGKASAPSVVTILKKSFLHDFTEGLKTLLLDKKINFIACLFFVLSAIIGALYVVGVVFIQETLKSMTRDVGILGMCLFAGLLVGSYIYGKAGQKLPRGKIIFMSIFITGLCINAFAIGLKITGSFYLGSLIAALTGFFVSPIYVAANTVIHESPESALRGRVFSSIGIIMNLGFLIFMLISSVLAEHIAKVWILIGCGTLFSLFGILVLLAERFGKITSSF